MMMEGILAEPEAVVSQQRRIVAVSAREIVGGLFIEVAKTDDLHSWLSSLRLRLSDSCTFKSLVSNEDVC